MDAAILSTIIALATGAIGSWFTYIGTRNTATASRLEALDARIRILEARERVLWMYCQTLILHINQGKAPPAPPWPTELDDLNP